MSSITVYSAGSMWDTLNKGIDWRNKKLAPVLDSFGWKHHSPPEREPVSFEAHGINPDSFKKINKDLCDELTIDLFKVIVPYDLKVILFDVDLVVVYYTKESAGTCSEITWAKEFGIPVHIVTRIPIKEVHPWIKSRARSIHASWEGLFSYFRRNYPHWISTSPSMWYRSKRFLKRLIRRIGFWLMKQAKLVR